MYTTNSEGFYNFYGRKSKDGATKFELQMASTKNGRREVLQLSLRVRTMAGGLGRAAGGQWALSYRSIQRPIPRGYLPKKIVDEQVLIPVIVGTK